MYSIILSKTDIKGLEGVQKRTTRTVTERKGGKNRVPLSHWKKDFIKTFMVIVKVDICAMYNQGVLNNNIGIFFTNSKDKNICVLIFLTENKICHKQGPVMGNEITHYIMFFVNGLKNVYDNSIEKVNIFIISINNLFKNNYV